MNFFAKVIIKMRKNIWQLEKKCITLHPRCGNTLNFVLKYIKDIRRCQKFVKLPEKKQ